MLKIENDFVILERETFTGKPATVKDNRLMVPRSTWDWLIRIIENETMLEFSMIDWTHGLAGSKFLHEPNVKVHAENFCGTSACLLGTAAINCGVHYGEMDRLLFGDEPTRLSLPLYFTARWPQRFYDLSRRKGVKVAAIALMKSLRAGRTKIVWDSDSNRFEFSRE